MKRHAYRVPSLALTTSLLAGAGCATGAADTDPLDAFGYESAGGAPGFDPSGGGEDGETDGTGGETDGGGSSTGEEEGFGSTGEGSTGGASTGPAAVCGDGVVEGDEACDDGNLLDGDGCESDCTLTPGCGDGVFQAGELCHDTAWVPTLPGAPGGVIAGDVDGDGDADVIVSVPSQDRVVLYTFEGGSVASETPFATLPAPGRLELRDTDGDGNLDLLVSGDVNAGSELSLMQGSGTGSFAVPQQALYSGVLLHAFGHLNDDETMDGIVAVDSNNFPNVTYTYLDAHLGVGGNPLQIWVWAPLPERVALADMDEDGRDDLVSIYMNPPALELRRTKADGSFGPATTFANIPVSTTFILADMDADGDTDLVSLFLNDPQAMVIYNDGTAGVAEFAYVDLPAKGEDLVAGDFDGDGRPDLAVATIAQELVFLRGTGDSFDPVHSVVLGEIPAQMVVADANDDGRDDVLVALPVLGEMRLIGSAP